MLRIRPQRRTRISNRLALVGALTLGLALYSGQDPDTAPLSEQAPAVVAAEQAPPGNEQQPVQSKQRPSLSRLLFGHG